MANGEQWNSETQDDDSMSTQASSPDTNADWDRAEQGDDFGSPAVDPPLLGYVPDTMAETNRKSGLAWSAGIVFFSSIAFTLVLGWFADLLLGSSPWGLVGGIVLGSVIGFIQFFRITSKIFPHAGDSDTPARTLISPDDNDKR